METHFISEDADQHQSNMEIIKNQIQTLDSEQLLNVIEDEEKNWGLQTKNNTRGEFIKGYVKKLQETMKKKAGSNVFYVSNISVNPEEVTFTDKEKEILLSFQDVINTENEEVVELWRSAKKSSPSKSDAKIIEATDELEDDPIEVLSA